MVKRAHKRSVDVRDIVPEIMPLDHSYFDHAAFVEWINTYLPGTTERQQAARLGITRRHLRNYKAGLFTPHLDTYVRMLAFNGLPMGTWMKLGQ